MRPVLACILGVLVLGLGLVGCTPPVRTASASQTAEPTEAAEAVVQGSEPQMPAATVMQAEAASQPEVLTVTVTGSVVNLKSGPSLQHAVLGQVRQGDALAVTGISEDRNWLQVVLGDERLWIFAGLTDVATQRRVLPVRPASARPEAGPLPSLACDKPSLACDKEILLSIRESIASSWILFDWYPHVPLSDFEGVTVGGEPPRVLALNLRNLLTYGTIPPELGQLGQLQFLDLAFNEIEGPIPPELGQLRQLRGLYLEKNQLGGPIPPELGQLRQLRHLYLAKNQLGGPIPPELGQLRQLISLSLWANRLTGPLPPELGQLRQLQTLYLNENDLTGPIPPALGQLVDLYHLNLSDNPLSGCIPPNWQALCDCPPLPVCA